MRQKNLSLTRTFMENWGHRTINGQHFRQFAHFSWRIGPTFVEKQLLNINFPSWRKLLLFLVLLILSLFPFSLHACAAAGGGGPPRRAQLHQEGRRDRPDPGELVLRRLGLGLGPSSEEAVRLHLQERRHARQRVSRVSSGHEVQICPQEFKSQIKILLQTSFSHQLD